MDVLGILIYMLTPEPIWPNPMSAPYDEDTWNSFDWVDPRPKPTWSEIVENDIPYRADYAYKQKLDALRRSCDMALSGATGYPVSETDGWASLYLESTAYQTDNNNIGPILSAYIAEAGAWDTLESYTTLVINKHLAWSTWYGTMVAKRRSRQNDLDAILSAVLDGTATISDINQFSVSI